MEYSCLILLSLTLSTQFYVVNGDLCKDPTEEALALHLDTGVPPKGGTQAGEYGKINGVKDFGECVKACCKDKHCNAVFYSQGNCLTIRCKTDDSCSPGTPSANLSDALLINLRTVAETAAVGKDKKDMSHPVSCEQGLFECSTNEECRVPDNNQRVKTGICSCKDGYIRNSVSGSCLLIADDSSSTEAAATTTAVAKAALTHQTTPEYTNTSSATNSTAGTTTSAVVTTTASPMSTLTTTVKVTKLTVSAGDNRVVKYPENSAKLTAFALPAPSDGEAYTYHWSWLQKPTGDEIGQTKGIDEQELELSKLVVGFYSLSVEVKGPNKYGTGSVNITVEPAPKVNQKPVAVIKPEVLKIKEDTAGILDGFTSTDDNKVVTYLWEIASGPITEQLKENEGSMLTLKDLTPGNYSIRLTVADEQGETNSTLATVIVEEGVDYKPKANSGDDMIVTLPQNYATLYGNLSSDDKGIVSYQWTAKAGDVSADTDGVDTPVLHLSHLREGVYTYELEVTDTKGQKATDEVHVYVKLSQNKPPVADTEFNVTTVVPGAVVVLDGSFSTDDQGISTYSWHQVSGPKVSMDNTDRVKASVDDLIKGDYVFELTVTDGEGLTDSTSVSVIVRDEKDRKPIAKAGNDKTVVLPVSLVKLDGSKSESMNGKLTYGWARSEESPGAGKSVNGSDRQAVLLLTDLVSGSYIFTLTVTDEEGEESSDSVTLNVEPDPQLNNLVELSLDTSIETFTEKHKNNLAAHLALLLSSEAYIGSPEVEITGIYPDYHSGKLTVLFLVKDVQSSTVSSIRNGTEVKHLLQKNLAKDKDLLGFKVSQVDTVVCLNDCSGHGHCDQFSKTCVCEPFWMPNYIAAKWKGESNCDWSILYVVITALASVFLFIISIWFCVCCTRRCKRTRGRRKHTYKLLHDIEEMENEEKLAKKKRSNITAGNGSIFLSETDLSSDEDTLFMNGEVNRNLHKPQDNLVKANNLKNKLRA